MPLKCFLIRDVLAGAGAAAVLSVTAASGLEAQQYVTDDAAITEYRGCQIQMWHGERSSWVLPVCTLVPRLELSLGLIAVWKGLGVGCRPRRGSGWRPAGRSPPRTRSQRHIPIRGGIG